HALGAGIGRSGRPPKNFMTPSRPETTFGLCWMYSFVRYFGASFQWPASSRSRMMCITACLLVFNFGSGLVKSFSGSAEPTGATCARRGVATNSVAANESDRASVVLVMMIDSLNRFNFEERARRLLGEDIH